MNNETRKWVYTTPAWYDNWKESGCDGVWWDPKVGGWRPVGTIALTMCERKQAFHAERFAQWASHKLAKSAPQRGVEACRRAIMRLVAAWCARAYTVREDRVLDAWFRGTSVSDHDLAEEAKSFGYRKIADILEPRGEDDPHGGIQSLHKGRHW